MNKTVKIILAVVAAAALLSTISYFRYPYDTETARIAEVRKTITGSGFILRRETVMDNETTGVFEPLVKDGVRVARGSTVGTVLSGDLDEKLTLQLEEVTDRIEEIRRTESIADLYASDDARIYSAMKALTEDVRKSVDDADYKTAQEYKVQLEVLAEKKNSAASGNARDELLVSLQKKQYELETMLDGVRAELQAPEAGFFYTELDGLEDYGAESTILTLTPGDIDGFSSVLKDYSRDRTQIAKVEDSYAWYLAASVPKEEAQGIESGETVKVSIDEQTAVQANVLVKNEEGDKCALVLKSNKNVKGIMEKRVVEFEIEKEYYKGIRVPAEAMRVLDDVTGVYVISENKMVSFRCVDILSQEEDCYIVRNKYLPPEGSKYPALKIYDNILVNPEAVRGNGKDIGKSEKHTQQDKKGV